MATASVMLAKRMLLMMAYTLIMEAITFPRKTLLSKILILPVCGAKYSTSQEYPAVFCTTLCLHQGVLTRETKRPYIRELQYAMCLQKATAMCPNAIFFCCIVATNHKTMASFSLVFSISYNPGAISLSRVAFHMESEKHDVLSPPLKLLGLHPLFRQLLNLPSNLVPRQ